MGLLPKCLPLKDKVKLQLMPLLVKGHQEGPRVLI